MQKVERNSLPKSSITIPTNGANHNGGELENTFQFTKQQRLLSSKEFSRVFDSPSVKISHPNILILAIENSSSVPRLGLVVAKKNLKKAVDRNRFKRLVRESFRLKQHHIPPFDAIVLARRGLDDLTNQEILKILSDLWKRVAKKAQKMRSSQKQSG